MFTINSSWKKSCTPLKYRFSPNVTEIQKYWCAHIMYICMWYIVHWETQRYKLFFVGFEDIEIKDKESNGEKGHKREKVIISFFIHVEYKDDGEWKGEVAEWEMLTERKKREKVICTFYSFLINPHSMLLLLSHCSCNIHNEPNSNWMGAEEASAEHSRQAVYLGTFSSQLTATSDQIQFTDYYFFLF